MSALEGKIAVVTGATSGIGRAISLYLARENVQIVAVARTESKLKELAAELKEFGCKLNYLPADLSEETAPANLADKIGGKFAQIDILIHSAGYFKSENLEDTNARELDRHFSVNFRAPYLLTKGLLTALVKGKGQVVFVNSSVFFQPGKPGLSAYAASKFALKAFADSLREEVNFQGVRVLSIFPGRTATAMQADIHKNENRTYSPERLLQPEDIAEQVIQTLKMPATAEITDISIRPFMKNS